MDLMRVYNDHYMRCNAGRYVRVTLCEEDLM